MYNDTLKSKLQGYFENALSLKDSTRGFRRGDCPICDGKFSFGINYDKGKANCFKCNDAKVSLLKLVQMMERFVKFSDVTKFLQNQAGYEHFIPKVKETGLEVEDLELPESYKLITLGDSIISRAARKYMVGRGFSLPFLERSGVGYCTRGSHQGYIILPYYENGEIIYYNARRFMGSGPKFNNPSAERFGVGKNTMMYNVDALLLYNYPYLVESVTNSLTLKSKAVGFGGKTVSPWQFSTIIKAPTKGYTILLDRDAMKEALELALQIVPHKKVRVVKMPPNIDVNQLGRKGTLALVKQTPWANYSNLYKEYLHYK